MAKSLNKVVLIGNVGYKPDFRVTQSGMPVCTLSLVTNDSRIKAKNGDKPDWHQVVIWKHLAEFAAKRIGKGSRICVEGKLRSRHFHHIDKKATWVTEIVAMKLIILDNKGKDSNFKYNIKNKNAEEDYDYYDIDFLKYDAD